MSEDVEAGDVSYEISMEDIEKYARVDGVTVSQPQQPAVPTPRAIDPGYFATPVQAIKGLASNGVPYFSALLRIHASIMPKIFGVADGALEVALTAMDGAVARYIAQTGAGARHINQREGIIPVPMIREFGSPADGVHYQLRIAMFEMHPGIRYFVEVQHGSDHRHRKVFQHPIVWDGSRIIFDYTTHFK